MSENTLERIYETIDTSNTLLKEALDYSTMESLFETLQNMTTGRAQVMNGLPDAPTKEKLDSLYRNLQLDNFSSEEIRKGIQLALIQATRADQLQANHQLTPDTIAMLVTYFLTKLIEKEALSSVTLLDLTVGTGNLMAYILNNLEENEIAYRAFGNDNDDLLIGLAEKAFTLQKLDVYLTLTDSVQPLLQDPVDFVISDLPVGYYPIDQNTMNYQTKADEGHSYTHHLLIEQGFNYLKDSGWGIYIVPNNLFNTDEGVKLMHMIQNLGHLQAFLELPANLFKSKSQAKSILLVQKKGEKAAQASQTLIGTIPEIKNTEKIQAFLNSFNNWLN